MRFWKRFFFPWAHGVSRIILFVRTFMMKLIFNHLFYVGLRIPSGTSENYSAVSDRPWTKVGIHYLKAMEQTKVGDEKERESKRRFITVRGIILTQNKSRNVHKKIVWKFLLMIVTCKKKYFARDDHSERILWGVEFLKI